MADAPQWFVAILLHRAEIQGEPASEAVVDHQLRLVLAADATAAYDRVRALGLEEEHRYTNDAGEEVHWRFLGLHDLVALEATQLTDGGEIYSWVRSGGEAWRVAAQDELTVFWSAREGGRLASDVLDDDS